MGLLLSRIERQPAADDQPSPIGTGPAGTAPPGTLPSHIRHATFAAAALTLEQRVRGERALARNWSLRTAASDHGSESWSEDGSDDRNSAGSGTAAALTHRTSMTMTNRSSVNGGVGAAGTPYAHSSYSSHRASMMGGGKLAGRGAHSKSKEAKHGCSSRAYTAGDGLHDAGSFMQDSEQHASSALHAHSTSHAAAMFAASMQAVQAQQVQSLWAANHAHLQTEVSALRHEVSQLKGLLMAAQSSCSRTEEAVRSVAAAQGAAASETREILAALSGLRAAMQALGAPPVCGQCSGQHGCPARHSFSHISSSFSQLPAGWGHTCGGPPSDVQLPPMPAQPHGTTQQQQQQQQDASGSQAQGVNAPSRTQSLLSGQRFGSGSLPSVLAPAQANRPQSRQLPKLNVRVPGKA